MKLKTSNPTALAVAKYYGFTTHGKFTAWLNSMCPSSKLFFIENGIKSFIRVSRVKHLYSHAYLCGDTIVFIVFVLKVTFNVYINKQ